MASITFSVTTGAGSTSFSSTVADADVTRILTHLKAKFGASLTNGQLVQSVFRDFIKDLIWHTQNFEQGQLIPTALPFTDPI